MRGSIGREGALGTTGGVLSWVCIAFTVDRIEPTWLLWPGDQA
jgi:hypothetical protein